MQRHVVEYAGIPVGIAIPLEGALKFMAVKYDVIGLDGQRFRSLTDIRRAIGAHLAASRVAA